MADHKCITAKQMKKWKKENNKRELEKANDKAKVCVFCRRIWTKFWAEMT